jgi:endonuclease IV
MDKLCFATGNLWRIANKIDVMEIISQLDVSGVEYTYGKVYGERIPNEKDFDMLKNYNYNSVHAPFRLSLDLVSEEEFNETMDLIVSDYKKMGAKNIVSHPTQKLPDKLSKLDFITENLNPKGVPNLRPRLGFEKILEKRSDWGLCLDASHAYDWDPLETERIVKKWKKRIKQVHFSNNRYHKDHLTFKKVSRGFLKSIEPLSDLNVPIIIEEDMPYTKVSEIKKEIKRVREILAL